MFIYNLLLLILGVVIYPFKFLVPIKKGLCLFGADKGFNFSQNSRYLFLYLLENHQKEYEYVWMTQSKKVKEQLQKEGYPVVYNFSLKGLYYSLCAEYTFFSTSFQDVLYPHSKKGKKFIYLAHGMPTKYVHFDFRMKTNLRQKINKTLNYIFVRPQGVDTVTFIPAASNFFKDILIQCTRNKNVFVTGEPRTDTLMKLEQSEVKKMFGFNVDDFIISYMPTHRYYGLGPMTPDIFRNDKEAIEFFKKNKIKIIWKHHMNMVGPNYNNTGFDEECFRDYSNSGIDSQYLFAMSDIIITDHSSVYIDFMLLNRPIIFYWYDNFEETEAPLYYNPLDLGIGQACQTEKEMLELIKRYRNGEKQPKATVDFHHFFDSSSCERIYKAIFKGETHNL